MKKIIERKHSIYIQMLYLLLIGTGIAVAVFFAMEKISDYQVESYLETSNYQERRNNELIGELQEYVRSEQLCSRDSAELNKWVQKQKMVVLSVYKDGILVFDSTYPDEEMWDEEISQSDYTWLSYQTIEFLDGTAEVILTGAYRYQLYNIIGIIELILSFVIFLVIVLLGLRKKMAYIRLLSNEVDVLEGGSLDYPITIKGKDELSVLAEGLNSMRQSFQDSRKKEEEIVGRNQKMITELSHDLRTPVTSILLYTEILKSGKYQNEKQKDQYLERIVQKALQMKQRTDRLLEYSLQAEEKNKVEVEEARFTEVFYELLSETCGYLEQKGFHIDFQITWTEAVIKYNEDYVVRILDNIMSNIVKYADPKEPVQITSTVEQGMADLTFQNRFVSSREAVESTGIGIQSIRSMMKELGGECHAEQTENDFCVKIRFPILA